MSKYVVENLDKMKKKMGIHMGKKKVQKAMSKTKVTTSDGYMMK